MGQHQSQPILEESTANQSEELQVSSKTFSTKIESDETEVDKHLCDAFGLSSFEARVRWDYDIKKYYDFHAKVESMGPRGPGKVTTEERIRRASADEREFLNYLEARKRMCEDSAADKHLCDAFGLSSFEARVRWDYDIKKHYDFRAKVESMGSAGPGKVTAEEQICRASVDESEFLNYLEARKRMCEELAADKHLCDASG